MSRRPRAADFEAEDAPPEADRLEGFPHPREAERLIGQERAWSTLSEALASGRMHHAWLLTGPEGIGKATLAHAFARHALAPNGEPGLTAQVRALSHPGLMLIRRPWNRETKRLSQVIPVDEVRRLKSFLQHSAGLGGRRVAIIDAAEDMNANAANALLKSLEEPPAAMVFLLVSSQPGGLLPTIHSRCRRLDLKALGELDLIAAAKAAFAGAGRDSPKDADLAAAAPLAEGSVRRLLELLEGGASELHGRLLAILAKAPKIDYEAVHKLADGLMGAEATPKFDAFHRLASGFLSRAVRAAASGAPLDPAEAPAARALIGQDASPARLASWAELWETIVRDKALAEAINLDRRALILDMFARIEALSKA